MKAVINWNALDSYFNFQDEEEVAALALIHQSLAAEKKREREEAGEAEGVKSTSAHVPPKKHAPEAGRVEEIEQHNYRDNQLALFAYKGSINSVINKPPQIDVLGYCARYRNEMPWYMAMQSYIASAADSYDYPDVPVMSRAMLAEFLRAPKNPGERECINLDREPFEGEQRMRCEAHRLSCIAPGSAGGNATGFRLRELILGDTLTRVNEAIARKQDYSNILDTVPDMCFLCHLWTYLKNSTHQRDKKTDKVVIINRFMVIIDQPGEYDRNKMLMSEKVRAGLWGPVPLYNRNNYIVHHKEQRIEESANLLFRLTRAPLPLTDASKQKASNPSNPTNATPSASGVSRQ